MTVSTTYGPVATGVSLVKVVKSSTSLQMCFGSIQVAPRMPNSLVYCGAS